MLRTLTLIAILATPLAGLAQGTYGAPAAPAAAPTGSSSRQLYVMTVHLDAATGLRASANHPAEAFPQAALPGGGGLILRAPNEAGEWSMRAFIFVPAQLIVRQGEAVTLNFVDMQGPAFRIAVDGQAEPIAIRRGEIRGVTLDTSRPGSVGFRALDQAPTMVGEVLVLPR